MRNLVYRHNGKTYRQISKTLARKAYNFGGAIALVPCNLYALSSMVGFYVMSQSDICGEVTQEDREKEFNARVANFEYYNCVNRETGTYANFFSIV
jgi:hypothetical protein